MVRRRRQTEDNIPPLDMTPMIDCVFLLLVFFILTARFIPEEQQIRSLLPTDRGTVRTPSPPIPQERIVITVVPDGFPADESAGELQARVRDWRARGGRGDARLRIGGSAPIRLDRTLIAADAQPAAQAAALAAVHAAVARELEARERPVAHRSESPSIELHAFSGLPWGYALVAFDAIRAFEAAHGAPPPRTAGDLSLARAVTFAPPRVRRYSALEDGHELQEVLHLR